MLRFHRLTFILLLFVVPLQSTLYFICGYVHELASPSLYLSLFASCWCELGVFFWFHFVDAVKWWMRQLRSNSTFFFFFYMFNVSLQIDGKIVHSWQFLSVEWVAVQLHINCQCWWLHFIHKIDRNMRRGSMNRYGKSHTLNRSMPRNSVSPTFRLTTTEYTNISTYLYKYLLLCLPAVHVWRASTQNRAFRVGWLIYSQRERCSFTISA